MALKKVKGNLERMFDKNLTDLVRGVRNNKDNEAKYIAQCIEEIKQELRQENISVKATAVAKLTYLQMLGYDISWAGFNIIEVMSSSKFTYKRIGYLASSQCFHCNTELLMLTTNMIRKDLNSQNQYDAGLALSALACFISADLARDLANDIMMLLTSTKPYLRKKAVLMMYKVFLRFPEALRPAFPRLKEKLEDPDSGVQSAAVNVVCELARKNPKNYLSLAPIFFKLMTSSTNNWMLIKIIKLFGALTPLEPRLGKKLIEPLTNLIHSTSAMSLLYECINTVIAVLISISSGMPNHSSSIQLCVQKLRILIEDSDQNLKYLGLLAMSKILKTHPKSVQAHKDLIMQCLDDKDESIRLRALDLLYGMVSKKTLMEIVKKLMVHMNLAEGTMYRDELLAKIVDICSQNNYQYITNFEWYVSVLVELTRMDGTQHGPLVAQQMMDVAIRVQAIRAFAVQQMALLLENAHILTQPSSKMADVLYAAAWICGEYASLLPNRESTLSAMLGGRVNALPGHIQAYYVQNILKIFATELSNSDLENDEHWKEICSLIIEKLPQLIASADLEVQERASSALHLVKFVEKQLMAGEFEVAQELSALFSGELNPVAPKAQRKVQVPEGLNLDEWINDPLSSDSEDAPSDEEPVSNIFAINDDERLSGEEKKAPKITEEDIMKARESRKIEQANNPNYLKMDKNMDVGDIPVAAIDLAVPLTIPGLASSDNYLVKKSKKKQKTKKKRKSKKEISSEEDIEEATEGVLTVEVNRGKGEMPEGAQDSDNDTEEKIDEDDPHRALDINLDEPLRDEERLTKVNFNNLDIRPKSSKKTVKSQNNVTLITPSGYEEMESELANGDTKKKKKKKKAEKEEKTKKHKHSSKKSKKLKSNISGMDELLPEGTIHSKEDYEEALGISTPSKEVVTVIPTNRQHQLVDSKLLSVEYLVTLESNANNRLDVSLTVHNKSATPLKEIEMSVANSLNVQLINEVSERIDSVKLLRELSSESSTTISVKLQVGDSTIVHRLRGTLSYNIELSDGSMSVDKLDFWLRIPVSSFLRPVQLSSTSYAELLAGSELVHKSSVVIQSKNFSKVLEELCSRCNLSVIEKINQTASLYSQSAGGFHICILLKTESKHISVETKSNSQGLLSNLMEEIQSTFAST